MTEVKNVWSKHTWVVLLWCMLSTISLKSVEPGLTNITQECILENSK